MFFYEVAFSGGVYAFGSNSNFYLKTDNAWWYNGPSHLDIKNFYVRFLLIYISGAIGTEPINAYLGIRPVILIIY